MKNLNMKLSFVIVLSAAAFLTGCASSGVRNPDGRMPSVLNPDERGPVAGTGIESQDIVAVTDKMARSILALPEIANATTPPSIALDPVINNTRFPINKDIFLDEIVARLMEKAGGKVQIPRPRAHGRPRTRAHHETNRPGHQ